MVAPSTGAGASSFGRAGTGVSSASGAFVSSFSAAIASRSPGSSEICLAILKSKARPRFSSAVQLFRLSGGGECGGEKNARHYYFVVVNRRVLS